MTCCRVRCGEDFTRDIIRYWETISVSRLSPWWLLYKDFTSDIIRYWETISVSRLSPCWLLYKDFTSDIICYWETKSVSRLSPWWLLYKDGQVVIRFRVLKISHKLQSRHVTSTPLLWRLVEKEHFLIVGPWIEIRNPEQFWRILPSFTYEHWTMTNIINLRVSVWHTNEIWRKRGSRNVFCNLIIFFPATEYNQP